MSELLQNQNTSGADTERLGWTSASAADDDLKCPGRHQAQRPYKGNGSGKGVEQKTPEAERGDRIHAALAQGTPYGTDKSPKLEGDERDAWFELKEKEGEVVFQVLGEARNQDCIREKRLWISLNPLWHSGKPDVVWINNEHNLALVLDYKTGRSDVPESPRNQQLRDLAVLVASHYGVREVAVSILQIGVKPEVCLYQAMDLAQAVSDLERRVTLSNDPNAKRIPGESQCRFCLAKGSCLEYGQWMGIVPALPPAKSLPLVSAHKWTPQQRALYLDRRQAIRKQLDVWDTELEELAAAGDPESVPGWHLVDGEVREPIVDAKKVFERFMANPGASAGLFMKAVRVTKTDLRDALAGVTGLAGKALTEKFKDLIQGCTERNPTKRRLERIPHP